MRKYHRITRQTIEIILRTDINDNKQRGNFYFNGSIAPSDILDILENFLTSFSTGLKIARVDDYLINTIILQVKDDGRI